MRGLLLAVLLLLVPAGAAAPTEVLFEVRAILSLDEPTFRQEGTFELAPEVTHVWSFTRCPRGIAAITIDDGGVWDSVCGTLTFRTFIWDMPAGQYTYRAVAAGEGVFEHIVGTGDPPFGPVGDARE